MTRTESTPSSLPESDQDTIDPRLVQAMEDYLRRLESGVSLDLAEFLDEHTEI